MKNLIVNNYIKTKTVPFILAGTMILSLTGCGPKKEEPKFQEGILIINDETFLIEYKEIEYYPSGAITITLTDNTLLETSVNNFYQYDKNSEVMNKIKDKVITEENIIK